jgi:hypothetical protein
MLQLITILNQCQRFPGFVYQRARFSSDRRSIEIRLRPRKGSKAICSRCHQPAPGYDQLAERPFEFIPVWGFLVFLLYAMRRVECRRCRAVVVEEVPWADGKHTLTKVYMLFLARWARRLSICLKLPPRSPDLNAFAEPWVRSVKEECLFKLIFFGDCSLRRPSTVTNCDADHACAVRAGLGTVSITGLTGTSRSAMARMLFGVRIGYFRIFKASAAIPQAVGPVAASVTVSVHRMARPIWGAIAKDRTFWPARHAIVLPFFGMRCRWPLMVQARIWADSTAV